MNIPPTPAKVVSNAAKPVFNLYLLGCTLVAALGGLLFGFDTAVISGTTDALRAKFVLSDGMLGFTVASALIGTIIGSIGAGRPADVFGRRGALAVLGVIYFVSALGCAFSWDWWSFISFRLLGGLAVGGASVVSPLYIAEISPAYCRGRMVAITQFNVVLGILLAYLSNYLIGGMHLGENEWRWMFGIMAAPALVFFLLIFLTPQSPRWLVGQGRLDEARGVLQRCGSDTGNVDDEIREIQHSMDLTHHSLREQFYCRRYMKPIMLAVAMASFNQLSGINAVLYYTPSIFKAAGAGVESALLQSVIVGFTMLVFTMAALVIIDHFGRRKLMIVGSIGYIIGLTGAAYAFYAKVDGPLLLVSLLIFIAAHGFGQGAVIWVFISEIFPNRVRARGQALGSFTHWAMNAAISWTFPMIAAVAGWTAFGFYALCMVGQLVWVLLVMPETKGISLEKIQEEFGIE
ncbi:MAG: sugar porter family MFS transporter [Verrucomicrobia bacterium]|nr:MAG: sugar porter family MFS transporter [Verrucomicrobiota bacterium]